MIKDDKLKQLTEEVMKKVISEQGEPQMLSPKAKTTRVIFDQDTDAQFDVVFSERGFLIGETRLSFEAIEDGISKNYDIILNAGNSTHLTQVRMQKIMKYRDLY